ncbi:MAG: hypothetical protein R3C53_18170 [Pirellulaceae bacterium]
MKYSMRARRRFRLLLVLPLTLCVGCPQSQPQPKSDPPPVAEATEAPESADIKQSTDAVAGVSNEAEGASELATQETANPAPKTEELDNQLSLESAPQGTWTTRRLVALAPNGPVVVDLSFSVGGASLEEASAAAVADISEELLGERTEPMKWAALLQLPVVRSGWLGNLVPNEEQEEQLISMMDTSKDEWVDPEEMPAFLSRGLSRSAALQVTDIGNAADYDINASPWGIADLDNDYSLSAAEMAEAANTIQQLDLNGDQVVTSQEVAASRGMQVQEQMSTRSMLQTSSVVFAPTQNSSSPADDDDKQYQRERRKLASTILRYYTFLEALPRDQWSSWSDDHWALIDRDKDQEIDVYDVEHLFDIDSQVQYWITLPTANEKEDSVLQESSIQVRIANTSTTTWDEGGSGGKLTSDNLLIQLVLDDSFDAAARQRLRNRLELALGNAQLKGFFNQQLQLSDGAFELIDTDGDEKLSDQEFETVWRWLTVRQGSRILARWAVAGTPWFQLIDANGDNRMTEMELRNLTKRYAELDRDADGLVTPNEMPLAVLLEVSRVDSRLAAGPLDPAQTPEQVEEDADWFAAMDTNRDGSLSRSEFLGTRDDFIALDSDKDGFVSRAEVVHAP